MDRAVYCTVLRTVIDLRLLYNKATNFNFVLSSFHYTFTTLRLLASIGVK